MASFTKLKKQLNPEQLEAVNSIEGPVMVLAGPGTGKTQVVALRITEILQRSQIGPRNILALTFTEAGVTALRTRLESIIGPEAYQVTINTFHGFANEIITTFPYLFRLDETAQQLNELERYLILEKIIRKSSDLRLLRPPKTPTAHVGAIGAAIKTLKQEAVTPTALRKLAEREIKELEKADLKKLEKEKRQSYAEKNLELADIYEQYRAELKKQQCYDYEDMILLVVEALKENDELRLHYQERYQYMLVDEYQDSNNGQNALVEALADFFVNPNLFVVGDDQQAIYRFQGASVANMLHFTKKYPAMKVITLKENYRSTPQILTAATELISHNEHQLGHYLKQTTVTLEAANSNGEQPVLIAAPTIGSEYDWIINEAKGLLKKGVAAEEIAVLFRRNKDVRRFRRLAEKNNLAVGGGDSSNLIGEPEIQLLLTILRSITDPTNDAHALPTLRLLADGPELLELLEINNKKKAGQNLVAALAASNDKKLIKSAATLLELHKKAAKASLVEFFEIVIQTTTLLEQTRLRPSHIEGLELLAAFLDEARRYSLAHPTSGLPEFLEYIELLNRYNIQLPVARISLERSGIFIGTVHAAKGLEYDSVFLPDVDEAGWAPTKNRSVIQLPSSIVELKNWNDDPVEDDRRVFFVGLTRAKRRLKLSYATQSGAGKVLLLSQFAAEIADKLTTKEIQPTLAQIEIQYQTTLSPIPAAPLAKRELAFIREKISSSPFSYTDFKTYRFCPKQYLLRSVFRLPSEPSIPLIYGNAVHRGLELFFRAFKAQRRLPSKDELLDYFRLALSQQPPIEHKQALVAQGVALLSSYYDRNEKVWQLPVGIEYSVRPHQVMLGDIWLTGKFDRVDAIDPKTRSVRLVDYKTVSRLPSRNDIEGNTQSSDGHLKTQLVFYSLLTDIDRLFPYKVSELMLSFLDNKGNFKDELFVIDKVEREQLKKEIRATFAEILARDTFPHTRDTFDKGCEVCAAFPSL